ncbi:MAG TPA: GAF domain-containing sensor histidine kinase [Solirubrobacteraceae bacterium]|nr:GAF domain-containing sensor histidine kinase [Solirubrobacteraceae bacterium]
MTFASTDERLRRLLDAGLSVVAELEPESVLERILEQAREITEARYAALGVLDDRGAELERFLTAGLDREATLRAVGTLPRGRGVLGVLIDDARPLRLADVSEHPHSYGFPPGHPRMRTFLGVPIMIRGRPWGNLYLAEKANEREFTADDEEAVVVLAQWAAIAIDNARLHEATERRRQELERAVRALEAARDISQAIGNVEDLSLVLELIAKRGRALVDARTLLILLQEDDQLLVAASAGHAAGALGQRLPLKESTSGRVLQRGHAERIDDVRASLQIAPESFGVPDARTALLAPMIQRGTALGVLAAFDRGADGEPFTEADEELLRSFAQSAANAVAINRSVETARLRAAIAAADAERGRWARELHDQTLQTLGGLRVLLASAQQRSGAVASEAAVAHAIEDIELEIANLRSLIADLRPALLDDIGLLPALEALLERRRESGLEIEQDLALPEPSSERRILQPALETTVYRLVQEALTNVVKHARAKSVRVSVRLGDGAVTVDVEDDGVGFDPSARTDGFGLTGMRERAYLAGGSLQIRSDRRGTRLHARLPLHAPARAGSPADQAAAQGMVDQLVAGPEPELAVDPRPVGLHRPR